MKIIDMHCDTIMSFMENDNDHLLDGNRMININKLQKGNYLLQCFAMFVMYKNEDKENYSPYEYCNRMIDRYEKEINFCKDYIKPVLSYKDIKENIKNNKLSSLLTIEEGGVLEGKLENLIHFYNRGVRMICLTWNFRNEIGYPNIDFTDTLNRPIKNPDKFFTPNTKDGLTDFGKEVVKKMNELGIVIDCSHAGDKTFYDVVSLSSKPIVCSHSCVRSVCNHVRNMSDDMLLKLKENGGVVGINYCHDFVRNDDKLSSIKDVVSHINYIRDLIGIDYIGFGSDFDGIENDNIELKDASMMPLVLDELRKQGYSEEDIDKISYKNVLRVFEKNFLQ